MFIEFYWGLWAIYGACMSIAFAIFWFLTRWKRAKWLAQFLRLMFVLLAVTPAMVDEGSSAYAPAIIVSLFDYFQGNDDRALDATINLIIAAAFALVIYLMYAMILLIVHLRRRRVKLS